MMTTNDVVRGVLEMEKDATVKVVPGRDGVTVRAVCGTVLVTQAGDLEDHVLERGMEHRFRGGGAVVAWALRPSRLAVVHARAGHDASAAAPLAPASAA
ncbi:MAG TPA: DUF2917 domain-containing protein [Anaeromyxobacteraceae bacterium]|nr:DUF2917 domain-containing protein [Anaeromyxobacteraceae bacterium]